MDTYRTVADRNLVGSDVGARWDGASLQIQKAGCLQRSKYTNDLEHYDNCAGSDFFLHKQ